MPIDNWANTEVLDLVAKKRKGVRVTIFPPKPYDRAETKEVAQNTALRNRSVWIEVVLP